MNLDKLKSIDIKTVKLEDLVDIEDVEIDERLNKEEKIYDYLQKIRNPYCYKYKDYVVKVSFADTSETLTDRLEELILKTANVDVI